MSKMNSGVITHSKPTAEIINYVLALVRDLSRMLT